MGDATAVQVTFFLVEQRVTACPLLGNVGCRHINSKIVEKTFYPLLGHVALGFQYRYQGADADPIFTFATGFIRQCTVIRV